MITRVCVRNYKSLHSVELGLGPLNVLVGPNMGGKSNIIDVFRFLQQVVYPSPGTEGLSYAIAQRTGIQEIKWKGGDESVVGIILEGEASFLHPHKFRYELEILAGAHEYHEIQNESLKLLGAGGIAELIVTEGGSRWLANVDGKKVVSSSRSGRSALQNAPENWDGFRLARSLGSWHFFQLVPQIMKDPNPTGMGEALQPHGNNLSAWLMMLQTRYPDSFARINEVAQDVFPDLRNLVTWPSQQGTVHLASNERGLSRPVNVWQMSDGELAFLALLSLIYSPEELGGDLFCIEEPENHLHPRLLSVLVKLLRQVRQELARSGDIAQLVITTHSPYLVDQMLLEEITWVEKKNGETRVIRPADQNHLRKLIEDKELGLGDMVYSGMFSENR